MAMDFFGQQEKAKSQTFKLIVLMVLAVLAILLFTYPLIGVLLIVVVSASSEGKESIPIEALLDPRLIIATAAVIGLIVFLGSSYKIAQLRGGGKTVAELMGGRLLSSNTHDPNERKILNVVEEMAIASGVPVPPVYLLENESGINAFAAGYSPADAVIGVTQGSVDLLSRDQLQGVMAHEFSHILNGDMRMNIRLIGIVYGILAISLFGWLVFRLGLQAAAGSGRSRSKDKGGAVAAMLAIALVGILLVVIGAVGSFFGKLIKAAVSRQREYLADASAVQFTRNPQGIGDALKKIGGLSRHGKLKAAQAAEISHMCFAECVSNLLGSAMSTHPPLPKRIMRIDPQWDGLFPSVSKPAPESQQDEAYLKRTQYQEQEQRKQRMIQVLAGGAILAGTEGARTNQATRQGGSSVADYIGEIRETQLQYAQELIASIPQKVREAAREPYGARAVIYGLLLDSEDESVITKQLERIDTAADPGVAKLVHQLAQPLSELDHNARLPLVEMAISPLRELAASQYRNFIENVKVLVSADDKVDLFEWVLQRVLLRHLGSAFGEVKKTPTRYYNLKGVADSVAVLLSTLAYVGNSEVDRAQQAFREGVSPLDVDGLALKDIKQCSLKSLGEALDVLDTVALREKKKLIDAMSMVVLADGRINLKESELLRGICDSLGCPAPPFYAGHAVEDASA